MKNLSSSLIIINKNFPVAKMVKNLSVMPETRVKSLDWEVPLEKGTAIHSSILTWRILWTEKAGWLQSVGLQRVRHDWVTNTHTQSVSNSLWLHGPQHARLPCPSPTPEACSNSCPSSQWCHPTISSLFSPSPPALNLSQYQGLFRWVSSLHQVAKVLEFQL